MTTVEKEDDSFEEDACEQTMKKKIKHLITYDAPSLQKYIKDRLELRSICSWHTEI